MKRFEYAGDTFDYYSLDELISLYLDEGKSQNEAKELASQLYKFQEADKSFQRRLAKHIQLEKDI